MAMDFPASPTVGQTFTSGAVTYVWNGTGWAVQATSGAYVLKAGDTMTGNLLINSSTTPQIKVVSTGTAVVRLESGVGGQCGFNGFRNGLQRWGVLAGTNDTESGGNTGSSFAVVRCNDAGNQLDYPIWIDRSTGIVTGTGLVNYTAQTLTAPQQTQARVNVYAAPADALAYSGMQINGSMEVSQERTGGVGTAIVGAGYALDGWQGAQSLPTGQAKYYSDKFTANDVPGISSFFQMLPTVAQATMAPNVDFVRFLHYIEGYRFARVAWGTSAAVPVTVGFWFRASLAGTYRALMYTQGGASSTGWMPFTCAGGAAFQWITITFPAQTTGTWNKDNTVGAALAFEVSSSATPNLMASTANYATITGVVVLPGVEAPSAARSPFIMRPYDQELVTCMRQLQMLNVALLVSVTGRYPSWVLYPPMRSAPTVTQLSGGSGAGFSVTTNASFYQSGNNSIDTPANLKVDARL